MRTFPISLACSMLIAGCATIINGTHQEIQVASSPPGARVWIDNNDTGITPLSIELKRKTDHRVRIEMEGYQQAELNITRKWSGWIWGNLVLAPFILPLPIQFLVDYVSGGLYTLKMNQLYVNLQKDNAGN
jgi:uncharacterized protein YceK